MYLSKMVSIGGYLFYSGHFIDAMFNDDILDQITHLGIQLGGVLSTSQVAKSFIGTGLDPETEKLGGL